MKMIQTYANKKVLVLGLGKSGLNVALLLNKLGALVTVNDKQDFSKSSAAKQLVAEGIRVITGHHPLGLLDEQFELMVKNPGISYSNPMVKRAQELGLPILTEPEIAYEASEAEWIGVTGSNGKTTTTTLIGAMLGEEQRQGRVFDGGNIGIPLSQVVQEAGPDDTIVAELSSFQLLGIRELHPSVAVLTNIYDAHLDYHGDHAHYVAAKMRLTMNQNAHDFFVVNWDLPELRELAQQSAATIVPFSRKNAAGARAVEKDGVLYFDDEPIIRSEVLRLPGAHNRENALAALAVAKLKGVSTSVIKNVLTHFTGVKHRIQHVATIKERQFYNDSKATNVEATLMALNAFEQPVVLLAGGLDRHLPLDGLLPALKHHVRALVVFGETAQQLAKIGEQAGVPVVQTHSVTDAVPAAYAMSSKGDVVLLSPAAASWDQFPNFEVRGDVFIDAVRALKESEN